MNKVVQSFSKSGSPHDNAVAESFFASMKREEVYRTPYKSEHQFVESIDTYIKFYNAQRGRTSHSVTKRLTNLKSFTLRGKGRQDNLDRGQKWSFGTF